METQITTKPYQKAFACGGVALFLLTLALVIIYRRFSAEGFGAVAAPTMFASSITGFQAKRSKTSWGILKFIGVYLLVLFLVQFVQSVGRMSR